MVWKSYKFWLVGVTVAALIGVIIAVAKLLHFWSGLPGETVKLQIDRSQPTLFKVLDQEKKTIILDSYDNNKPFEFTTTTGKKYKLIWNKTGTLETTTEIVGPDNKVLFPLVDDEHKFHEILTIIPVQVTNPNMTIWVIESTANGTGHYNYGFWALGEINGNLEMIFNKHRFLEIVGEKPEDSSLFKVEDYGPHLAFYTGRKIFVGRGNNPYDIRAAYFYDWHYVIGIEYNQADGTFKLREPAKMDDTKN